MKPGNCRVKRRVSHEILETPSGGPYTAGPGASACSNTQTKAPDVTGRLRASLDEAGLNNVKVSQDRDKGVITLSGKFPATTTKLKPNRWPSRSQVLKS